LLYLYISTKYGILALVTVKAILRLKNR
jgi:hypothetical protein